MKRSLCALAVAVAASPALASELTITFENLQGPGGFSFSPVWLGAHDGTFDVFDAGAVANPGTEAIAELADASVVQGRFDTEQPGGVSTLLASLGAPPPFTPGESASTSLDVGDATLNRFLSFGSMVVPSNDLFIGNDDALELFDVAGNFNGPVVIEFRGLNVWDAGSEVNDITDGPAFVMGQSAAGGTSEGGLVGLFFSRPDADAYLDSITGLTTATGETISGPFGRSTLLARLTIVPSPGAGALACVAGLGLVRRRRR